MKVLALFLSFVLLGLVGVYAVAAPTVQIPGCPLGYSCVDNSMTLAQIQAVVNTGGTDKPPILFLPGDYALCAPLNITNSGTALTGPAPFNADNGSSGVPTAHAVRISCGSNGSFSAGQGIITINAQYVTVQNIEIVGLQAYSSPPAVDCIQLLSGGNWIQYNAMEDCFNGVHINAVNTGCCSTFNQVSHVEHNVIIFTQQDGILCETTTGSGCTDNFLNWNHLDVNQSDFGIKCGPGCGNGQIIGNRIEDGGAGIFITNSSPSTAAFQIVSQNYFQSVNTGIELTNSDNVIITDNMVFCNTAGPGIEFTGESGAVASIGNFIGACTEAYQVFSTETIFDGPATFNDIIPAPPNYADTHTANLLEQWTSLPSVGYNTITPSGTTFTPVLDGHARDFFISLTANSTLAAPAYQVGSGLLKFQFKQDATGGRTVTYNSAYKNTPTIGATANLCTYATAVMLGTNIIFQDVDASQKNVVCS